MVNFNHGRILLYHIVLCFILEKFCVTLATTLLTGGCRSNGSHRYHVTLHRTARYCANHYSYRDCSVWSRLKLLRRKLVDCPHVSLIHVYGVFVYVENCCTAAEDITILCLLTLQDDVVCHCKLPVPEERQLSDTQL